MQYPVQTNTTRLEVKQLMFLKHSVFHPQLTAPMETTMRYGTLNSVQEAVDSNINLAGNLNILLANSLEANISNAKTTNIVHGWNTARYSFLLIMEVYDGFNLIAEEILQGYTDSDEASIGGLHNGARVTLPDTLTMYVNRIIQITYTRDNHGNLSPRFNKATSVLVDPLANMSDTGMVLNRPFDMAIGFYTQGITAEANGSDEYASLQTSVSSDSSRFNGKGKLSSSDNEVAGRMMSKIVTSAALSKTANDYTFNTANVKGGSGVASYENMSGDLNESDLTYYHTIKIMGTALGRMRLTNWKLSELSSIAPGASYNVSTVESYNDLISQKMNTAFRFGGIDDKGDSSFSDNQITRFQKKIVPYLFDKMMSYGYILFSGSMTNKTLDGSIYVSPDCLLLNASNTVNSDKELCVQFQRAFLASITDEETKRVLGGDDGTLGIELVFDLKMESSIIYVDINGITSTIKIPSMSDGLSSGLISTDRDSKILSTEIKGVVDATLGIAKNRIVDNSQVIVSENLWS